MGEVRRLALAATVTAALVSCSLTTDLSGLSNGAVADGGDVDGGISTTGDITDGASSDGLLADVTTTVVDGCSNAGCFDMPLGFALVAYGASAKGASCPAGFATGADVVEGPSVGAGACTCACSVTAQPSCPTNGTIVGHYGGGGNLTCPTAGGNLVNTGCGTDGFLGPFSAGNEHRFKPPGPTGGACKASAARDASKLTLAAEGRVCQATSLPRCDTKVCPPALGAPFAVCIASAGDVACPQGFPNKHLVGTAADFTCGSGCSCTVKASCTGKLDYFASADCSGAAGLSVAVDDACHATESAGASYGSHKYTPNAPSGVGCDASGSTAPSAATLDQATTICCD